MAQRDRSQGFGFVYVDIGALLAQRDQFKKEFSQPVESPVESNATKPLNFPKRVVTAPAVSTGIDQARERSQAAAQIRENLDRLQSLHHKLHAMLEELSQLSRKKES